MLSVVSLLAAVATSSLVLAQPFQDSASFRKEITPCGEHIIEPGKTLNIQSANYPRRYPKDEKCVWDIGCTSPKATIDLSCSAFKISRGYYCKTEYLAMFDGSTNYIKACGKTPPNGVVSAGNVVTIEFVTNDDKRRQKGFDCTVTCIVPPATTAVPLKTTIGGEDSKTTLTSEPSCECGKSATVSRIVGGDDAVKSEYPWQVAITPKRIGIPYCGATLLNSHYIVTAAHCVDSIPVEDYDLEFCEDDWMKIGRVITRTPAEVIVHPKFNKATLNNDIAVVKLNIPISIFSHPQIKPVCLPSSDMAFEGKSGVATGWGLTAHGGEEASALQTVDLEIMSQSDCKAAYPNFITGKMMCAGGDGSDICQGDDGGPLIVDVDGSYVLAGISSHGDCAHTSKPGVFTDIQSHLPWIKSQLTSGVFCPVASSNS